MSWLLQSSRLISTGRTARKESGCDFLFYFLRHRRPAPGYQIAYVRNSPTHTSHITLCRERLKQLSSSPERTVSVQMLASLQTVFPSSVLSSLSSSPSPRHHPQKEPDDAAAAAAERDHHPSASSSNTRQTTVDEQGVKKKKGRSNEVSPLSQPMPMCHKFGCASASTLCRHLSNPSACATDTPDNPLHRHSSSFDRRPQNQTTRSTSRCNSCHPALAITTDRPPDVRPIP